MKLKLVRLAFIAAMPLATAVAPIASWADQPSATIAIRQEADLTATGSLLLTVDYSCNPGVIGPSGFLFTEVQQPGAFGSAFVAATCDDQKHTVTLDNVPGPFTRGTAAAFAVVESFGFVSFATTQAEVNVR